MSRMVENWLIAPVRVTRTSLRCWELWPRFEKVTFPAGSYRWAGGCSSAVLRRAPWITGGACGGRFLPPAVGPYQGSSSSPTGVVRQLIGDHSTWSASGVP